MSGFLESSKIASRFQRAARRLSGFLLGQAAVQGVNLVTGLAILWLLPKSEYALYIVCSTLISIGNVATDLGLSQALITFGSRKRDDPAELSRLIQSCQRLRRTAFMYFAPVLLALGVMLLHKQEWKAVQWVTCLAISFATIGVQRRIPYFNGLMNVRQDSAGLFATAIVPALLRFSLVIPGCTSLPLAATAMVANVIAGVMQDFLCERKLATFVRENHHPRSREREQKLWRFVTPLLPGITYYVMQGQVAVIVLSLLHMPSGIAEVGALGRLGQLLALLAMVNPFFVQPRLSAIRNKKRFSKNVVALLVPIVGFCLLLVATSIAFPRPWLFILGPRYSHLSTLLPIAVAGPLAAFVGSFLYTAVIATANTRLQWLQVPFGLCTQAVFLVTHGVTDTRDALILNWLPFFVYVFLQAFLLLRILAKTWPEEAAPATAR